MNLPMAAHIEAADDIAVEKEKYLQSLSVRRNTNSLRGAGMAALRQTVGNLAALGVSRATLRLWAVQAGYASASVSSLLSRVFCSLGLRQRRSGAGPKATREMRELAAHISRRYKSNALKTAYGACRVIKAQLTIKPALIAYAISGARLTADTDQATVREGEILPQ